MTFDLSRLGAWGNLPFFAHHLPDLATRIGPDTVLPDTALTFRALELCQPDDTKVVILGQDPYHTAGKADGLAFSIPADFGGRLDSLGNIFKELRTDLNVNRSKTSLDDWADQGVLLLNTALTVPEGQPKAHAKHGWDQLVKDALEHLNPRPCAHIQWGKPAQSFARHIAPDHLILQSAHPSPLSAARGFFGSRPFSTVNQWLIDQGQTPINWADP
ncbi:uracil-DNA glycosylase [Yoonia sp. 208BN28-4]|uniref:uracil-DNA glycosylase n=1 Tax=Yoonia sp. 208BN28-4 TaxID=3126505 RepID=UPI0030A1F8B1